MKMEGSTCRRRWEGRTTIRMSGKVTRHHITKKTPIMHVVICINKHI